MTASRLPVVIAVFEDRTAVAQAIRALLEAGFQENLLGFVVHQEYRGISHQQEESKERISSPGAIARGVVGGIMGAIDLLLVPIIGPVDASSMLATTLPAAEEVIDLITSSGMHSKEQPSAPNGKATCSEKSDAETALASDLSQRQESDQAQEQTSVVTGEVIGGIVGTVVAVLLLPEIGPVMAGGLLATVLSGATLGGMAGGFLGAFANMGVPKRKIAYYEQEMKANRTLVIVHTADHQEEAIEILSHYGAHDVATY